MKYFFLILLFNSCDFSEIYHWETNVELNQILKKADGRIILFFFETEW